MATNLERAFTDRPEVYAAWAHAAAARCFFSKALNGLGVRPDAGYARLDQERRDALVIGRPIADARESVAEVIERGRIHDPARHARVVTG